MGTLDAAVGSAGICESSRAGRRCSNQRMSSRVFCWALACSLASKSPDSSLATRSSASKAIGFRFSSMTMGCSGEKEGVLGAVYREAEELSESLVSIPYLAMVVDAHNSQSSRERVFYCKGNLAVRGNHSGIARDDPKNI